MVPGDVLTARKVRPPERAIEHAETLKKVRRADLALARSESRRQALLRAAELYRHRLEGR